MKILNISLDEKVIEKDSAVQRRILEYGELVDKYTVIVLAPESRVLELNSKVRIVSLRKINKILDLIKLKLVIWKTLRKEKYSLISVQDAYFIGFLDLIMARFFKIGLEIQVHGWEKFKGLRKILAKYVLKRADSIRVVSQRLKKQLIRDFNVDENKITVVPVYVKTENMNHQLRITDKNNNKFIFLTVGRLVPVKNIQMQIKAVANLKEDFPNIELWIIGDGPERDNYELRITNYGLQGVVKLLGYQNNLDEFYKQADCFLLTSDQEGWGMVVVEAASYGLPIIMTDVGCAVDFIKDKENGIIIPIKDQEELENNMASLIENSDLRAKLGKNAQESVQNLLTKEETLNLYKESWQKAIK
jgi:glycosyltransferase involved in cell wall biosynthesis